MKTKTNSPAKHVKPPKPGFRSEPGLAMNTLYHRAQARLRTVAGVPKSVLTELKPAN